MTVHFIALYDPRHHRRFGAVRDARSGIGSGAP